ncbi:hypothetical protein [Hyunsoonleella rubra]|uniref:SMODS-associating 2TM beta-strand rich effector domain-containing protein n=1 Tax=Hyunsoonleella rubra TaxID=1737062 RepID=A0ABW5T7V0_9FLAO
MRTARILLALVESILAFTGICFIGVVFYSQLSEPFNWIVAIPFLPLAIYLSLRVYKMIIRRGYLETVSGNNSSYDADELKPTPGSGITEIKPEELESHFDNGKILFSEVTVSIWGDWNGRQLNSKHKLSAIEFDENKEILFFRFSDFCQLQIRKPSIIHYTNSYLKIFKAKEIKWQVPNEEGDTENYYYLINGNNIQTKSNTNWRPKKEDFGFGMNAVYIQG